MIHDSAEAENEKAPDRSRGQSWRFPMKAFRDRPTRKLVSGTG